MCVEVRRRRRRRRRISLRGRWPPARRRRVGFRVSEEGFRVSEEGFRVSEEGFRVSEEGFRVSEEGFRLGGGGWDVRAHWQPGLAVPSGAAARGGAARTRRRGVPRKRDSDAQEGLGRAAGSGTRTKAPPGRPGLRAGRPRRSVRRPLPGRPPRHSRLLRPRPDGTARAPRQAGSDAPRPERSSESAAREIVRVGGPRDRRRPRVDSRTAYGWLAAACRR